MNNTKDLIKWYEELNLDSLSELPKFYKNECFFKDPFNELKGINNVKSIFTHMFDELEGPKFIFIDVIAKDNQSFLSWDFTFRLKGSEYKIHGSSHLKWSDGLIEYHRDYWDVGEEVLLKIPVVRSMYKLLVNKLSIKDVE